MNYTTPEAIHARYREELRAITGYYLDDDGNPTPECVTALVTAIRDAASEVDMALRARYRLPLAEVPPVLGRITMDIAVSCLPRNGAEYADLIERRAAAARKLLEQIARGDTLLDLPSAANVTGGGVGFSFPSSPLSDRLKDYL